MSVFNVKLGYLAWPYKKIRVHRVLLQVFMVVLIFQVSFETMFCLLWVKNQARAGVADRIGEFCDHIGSITEL